MFRKTKAQRSYDVQPELQSKMRNAGYSINSIGLCAGATMVAIETAINDGNIKAFDKAINTILEQPSQQALSLEARAVMDQIQIYSNPSVYYDLFSRAVSQHDVAAIAAVARSKKGLAHNNHWSWSGMYTTNELAALLECIAKSANKNQLLAFSLGNEHKIALIFKNNKWQLADIDDMPSKPFKNTTELAIKIQDTLGNKNTGTATFTVSAYSGTEAIHQTNAFLQRLYSHPFFIKHHRIHQETMRQHPSDIMKLAQLAVCNHEVNVLAQLMEGGLDVNQPTPCGLTLAYLAASYGHTDMLSKLIEAGAIINFNSIQSGYTPLMIATFNQHLDTVDCLLNNGANVHLESSDELTPIAIAANSGNLTLVKRLADSGADLHKKCGEYNTPRHIAKQKNYQAIIDFIDSKPHPAASSTSLFMRANTLSSSSSTPSSTGWVNAKKNT